MTLKIIVDHMMRRTDKFILNTELKKICKKLSLEYEGTVRYLMTNRYIERIFRGIFYVYSLEERKLGKLEMNFYEILSSAINLKGVKDWYFGLETGLKLNNLTHEYFSIEYVLSDKIFRAKSISILGRKVKFYKISPKFFKEGILTNKYPYSNPEKTLLDLVYLNHYSLEEFKEFLPKLDKKKLIKYSKNYNKKLKEFILELK